MSRVPGEGPRAKHGDRRGRTPERGAGPPRAKATRGCDREGGGLRASTLSASRGAPARMRVDTEADSWCTNCASRKEAEREHPASVLAQRVLHKSNADRSPAPQRFSRAPPARQPRPACHSARPARHRLAFHAADRRSAAAHCRARLNQLAGGLALCVLPSKNGNRGDSTERAAHGPGLAAGAGFRGATVRSLEKAGAGIKLVTVATQCSIRRQRRRAADDAGQPCRRRVVAAATGVALRIRG